MWQISRSLRRRRASPDVVEQGERCERICLRRMRHPRCQSANSNCGAGLNLRLPRCMLWPSETLSPLSSLPVSASGRCLSVRLCPLSHVAPQRYTPWAGRVGGACSMGLRSGVPSGFSAVRRFRVSTVRSSRVPVVRRYRLLGDLRSGQRPIKSTATRLERRCGICGEYFESGVSQTSE